MEITLSAGDMFHLLHCSQRYKAYNIVQSEDTHLNADVKKLSDPIK